MFTPAAARASMRTEAPEEATGCDAIRARIRQVTRQLRRAIANGNAPLARRLRRQLRTLRRRLAICQAIPLMPTMEMVTVGNPNNPPDNGNFGTVSDEFRIGKYEVTLAQYAAFLNAVAATDSHGLYHPGMATDLNSAGIARSGAAGGFRYTVIGTGTRPATYVSWFDAARFCNWLHNGQPSGLQTAMTTERGAYTLDGLTSGGATITRTPGAKFWIPSEDEWYKAAYHDPGAESSDYWLYPTRSNTAPGNAIGPLANQANFFDGDYSVTQKVGFDSNQNYLTVEGAYSGSPGFYGTFDQGGNVWEWNDTVFHSANRGLRGGAWDTGGTNLMSSFQIDLLSDYAGSNVGFRVAGQ